MLHRRLAIVLALLAFLAPLPSLVSAGEMTTPFRGKDVNRGTVTHEMKGGGHLLTLSPDFEVPGTPDPHWQVVDSRGTVYPLDRLKLHEDKINTSITVPSYIPDIAKVQIWCAWAEVLLGEASFSKPVVAYGKR